MQKEWTRNPVIHDPPKVWLFLSLVHLFEVLSEGIIAVEELKTLTPFHGLPHRQLYGLPSYFYSKKYIHTYIYVCVYLIVSIYVYACIKFIECEVLNCLICVAIFCYTKQICIVKPMNIFEGLNCTLNNEFHLCSSKEFELSALLKSIQLNLNLYLYLSISISISISISTGQ